MLKSNDISRNLIGFFYKRKNKDNGDILFMVTRNIVLGGAFVMELSFNKKLVKRQKYISLSFITRKYTTYKIVINKTNKDLMISAQIKDRYFSVAVWNKNTMTYLFGKYMKMKNIDDAFRTWISKYTCIILTS